jgi:hypothetical protein
MADTEPRLNLTRRVNENFLFDIGAMISTGLLARRPGGTPRIQPANARRCKEARSSQRRQKAGKPRRE